MAQRTLNRRKVFVVSLLFIIVVFLALRSSEVSSDSTSSGRLVKNIPLAVLSQARFCEFSCAQGDAGRHNFCFEPLNVIFDPAQPDVVVTETCSQLADSHPRYGFVRCPNFC